MYLETMQDILTHSPSLVVDDKLKGLVPFLPLNLPESAPRTAAGGAPSTAASPDHPRRHRGSTAMSRVAIAGIAVLVVLFVLVEATLFTVDQTEQVLITQFGQPVRVIAQAGTARQDARSSRR